MRTTISLLATCLAAATAFGQSINEIRTQQTGIDLDVYAEISGTAGADLGDLTLIVIGGDDFAIAPAQNGYIEAVIPLTGQIIPTSGYFVVGATTYSLSTPDLVSVLNFEVDNNKTYMLVSGFSSFEGDDVDLNDDGTLDYEPWTGVLSSVALVKYPAPDGLTGDFTYGATSVGPDGGSFPSQVKQCPDTAGWKIGFADTASGSDTPGVANPSCTGGSTVVMISELRTDQTGTDNDEYAELTGDPGTLLDGLTYLVIGDGTTTTKSGVVECIIPLDGKSIPASGIFVITSLVSPQDGIAFGQAGDFQTNKLIFENSDHVTHLVVRGFSGTATTGQDLDSNDDGVLNLTPWLSVVDSVANVKVASTGGPVKAPDVGTTLGEWTYQFTNADGSLTQMVGPDDIYNPGHIYRCSPQGSWLIGFFDPVSAGSNNKDTPKFVNPECSTCGVPGSGSCFSVHAGVGCDKGSCCSIVCAFVPACCDTTWDSTCVETAMSNCLAGGAPPTVMLSEMRIRDVNNTVNGSPTNQYVELVGTANASLTGVSLIVVNDQDTGTRDDMGVIDAVVDLSGLRINSAGRFLITESTFNIAGVSPDYNCGGGLVLDNDGTSNVYLVWNNFGARNLDLDTDNNGEYDVAFPWLEVIDSVSVVGGSGNPYCTDLVGPAGGATPSQVYRCLETSEWKMGGTNVTAPYDSPGADNATCDLERPFDCGDSDAGDCFVAHTNGHCFNRGCCEMVCAVAPDCCNVAWDDACVEVAAATTACGGGSPTAYISEARVDQSGTDDDEYIELRGAPGTSLDGLSIVVIGDGTAPTGGVNPLSGAVECVIPLTGSVIPDSGFFLITKLADPPTASDDGIALGIAGDLQTPLLNLENGDNITIGLVQDFVGAVNDDLDLDNDGQIDVESGNPIDYVSIVSSIRTAPGSSQEWWYGPRVPPNSSGIAFHIYRCDPVGYWQTGNGYLLDPASLTDTPGATNGMCPVVGSACFGDVDMSGYVDAGDAALALLDFGPCPGCAPDLDGTGEVDFGDIALILLSSGPCE